MRGRRLPTFCHVSCDIGAMPMGGPRSHRVGTDGHKAMDSMGGRRVGNRGTHRSDVFTPLTEDEEGCVMCL